MTWGPRQFGKGYLLRFPLLPAEEALSVLMNRIQVVHFTHLGGLYGRAQSSFQQDKVHWPEVPAPLPLWRKSSKRHETSACDSMADQATGQHAQRDSIAGCGA